ncbi:hypothetical protein N7530_010102 [Penicillium desertorum]|uniref:Major facilitator superfamily (MFS) profile domain-containing protein n=1 Tax=Penicillium desertorum TaxID=1303715 RepID=A0A9X0BIQ3_9EURO|nr:hypothetical protein N7530_010102 [Penicillium desertorum]
MQQSLLADSQVPDGGEAWVVIPGCAVGAPIAGFVIDAAGENKGILGYRPAIVHAGAMALASIIGLSIRRRIST